MKLTWIVIGAAVIAGVAAATVVIVNQRNQTWDRDMRNGAKSLDRSRYREIVAETLHEHAGEDTPVIRAFEDALEQEVLLEQQLARETGLER